MKLSLGSALVGLAAAQASTVKYSTITGYFLQDEHSTNASTFEYTLENFGLINRTYPADRQARKHHSLTQWERFYHQLSQLNENAPKHIDYKVLFLGRHGEGWHNAAETYYGTPAWNCYWAELDGNSTATWADASLTANGVSQALKANHFWQKEINEQRIHTPDSYYVSPLTRTLQTANLTFTGLDLPHGSAAFKPTIKELFREGISIHTCDHRRSRGYIRDMYPSWSIEEGFTEEDELWNGVMAETSHAQDIRSMKALRQIFEPSKKNDSFVSITSHSGEISSILRVLDHRPFSLNTGAVIPVLVKAEKVDKAPSTHSAPWTASPHCTEPPVSSVSACVCPSSAMPVTTALATGSKS